MALAARRVCDLGHVAPARAIGKIPKLGTLEVVAPGVLANDNDVDTPHSGLSAILVTGPAHAASNAAAVSVDLPEPLLPVIRHPVPA